MTCKVRTAADLCPTLDDVHGEALALLPQGRAWRSPGGGPEPGSVLWSFWRAVARVFKDLNDRICALAHEMVCQTIVETRDAWLTDYGLPSPCDPFPDLCTKVAAIGGTRCDYFQAIAARAGWSIACQFGTAFTVGCMQAGCWRPGAGDVAATLRIRVTLAASLAYAGPTQRPFQAGLGQAGQSLACGPDIGPLKCLLSRILPAHVAVIYEVV